MTAGIITLMALTGLALAFSMGSVMAVIVLHHRQEDAYDNDICHGCSKLEVEVSRLATAMSRMWRELEAIDGRRADLQGAGVSADVRVS